MRIRIALLIPAAFALLLPAAASGAFHLMKVSEVYPGDSADPDAEYIELQMHASGQNFVMGQTVTAISAGGASEDYVFGAKVDNGDSQRTILLATTEAEAKFGFAADLVYEKGGPDPTDGAVCFGSFDCVAWGSFAGALPGAAGTNAAAIPDGMSLQRTIGPGCPTLLEAGDDSDDSATDFAAATPSPRNNATAPTETACAGPGPGDSKVAGAKLTAKSKQPAKKAAVKATVGASEDVSVKVSASGKAGQKKVKLGSKTVDADAGGTEKVKLKASGKAKKAIKKAAKKGKKTKLTLKAKFTDAAGNKKTLKTTVKLK